MSDAAAVAEFRTVRQGWSSVSQEKQTIINLTARFTDRENELTETGKMDEALLAKKKHQKPFKKATNVRRKDTSLQNAESQGKNSVRENMGKGNINKEVKKNLVNPENERKAFILTVDQIKEPEKLSKIWQGAHMNYNKEFLS